MADTRDTGNEHKNVPMPQIRSTEKDHEEEEIEQIIYCRLFTKEHNVLTDCNVLAF